MNTPSLRLAFAGTPDLAAKILEQLLTHTRHRILMVYTQPDKPSGRGRHLALSPVKQLAQDHKLYIMQPPSPAEIDPGRELSKVDIFIVVAYGLILPASILRLPTHGCINVHTSLLPRWRGAAPIQRAILAGDSETGISIMQIDEGLDTGPLLAQRSCKITAQETSASLTEKLAELGAACLIETLGQVAAGTVTPRPQDPAQATYAGKITKEQARLDWNRPAVELERMIRAFNPAPVAYTELQGINLRVWEATVIEDAGVAVPGTIVTCHKSGIDVTTGKGILRLLRLQPAGKRIMTAGEFLSGRPEFAGQAGSTRHQN